MARSSPMSSPVVGRGDALAVSDANGANQRQILPAAGGVHAHWPAWSADGQFVYFIKEHVIHER